MTNQEVRVRFLEGIFGAIGQRGYRFETHPHFTEYGHGNLKFTDERLLFRSRGIVTGISLEHYFIKREQRHPLYWGLQSFHESDGTAADPVSETGCYRAIVDRVSATLSNRFGIDADLSLTEVKYGWFAWVCFPFTSNTIDMDSPATQLLLADAMPETVARVENALFAFIDAWHMSIPELR